MKIHTEKYGHWYRGRVVAAIGLWQFGVTVDFFAFQIGIAFPTWRCAQINVGFLTFDMARLIFFSPL